MTLRPHASLALLSHAVNESVRTGVLDLKAANRAPLEQSTSVLFGTSLGSIPLRVAVGEWRFDEVRIAVAAWPTPDVDHWLEVSRANERAGKVASIGYLARSDRGRLRLVSPLDPSIYIHSSCKLALQAIPVPDDASDPLRLYPRYLNYAAAA